MAVRFELGLGKGLRLELGIIDVVLMGERIGLARLRAGVGVGVGIESNIELGGLEPVREGDFTERASLRVEVEFGVGTIVELGRLATARPGDLMDRLRLALPSGLDTMLRLGLGRLRIGLGRALILRLGLGVGLEIESGVEFGRVETSCVGEIMTHLELVDGVQEPTPETAGKSLSL